MKRQSFPLFIALASFILVFLFLEAYSFSADKPTASQQQISQKSGLPSTTGKNQEIQNIKPENLLRSGFTETQMVITPGISRETARMRSTEPTAASRNC